MVNIEYSQNFYKNKENLKKLIKSSGISSEDIVLDIGFGDGSITKELSKYAKRVIAYELDKEYFDSLKEEFLQKKNVFLVCEDFLKSKLPNEDFKVFSNIPFFLTTDIIYKITDVGSKLKDAYLFVQKESADRFIGISKNTQIAAILSYSYKLSIIEQLRREDFKPIPNVDVVVLRIERKDVVLSDFKLYRDFISYIFNQMNKSALDTFKKLFTYKQLGYIKKYFGKQNNIKPTEISSEYYLEMFQYFRMNGHYYKDRVSGYYLENLNQHSKRKKVHRTRLV
jgi:23S rRNA (adenine-N6)-dimethyltransferase